MGQPLTLLPRAEDRLLLAEQGVATLPSAVALQLLDVPVVLPWQKQPPRDGRALPEAYWRVECQLTGADNSRYKVRITGDPHLGLPYGRDADVLLALFRVLDEGRQIHDLATGTLRQVSFQLICRALGLNATGPTFRRIRDALRRLSHVRIESRVLVDRSEEAVRLLAGTGSSAPAVPTSATVRRHEVEESRWLIEYRTEERTTETTMVVAGDEMLVDGGAVAGGSTRTEHTLWIHELRLNPFWVGQAITGWAGWIDVERHARLDGLTARRLYQLCAAVAARDPRLQWVFGEQQLRVACLLDTDDRKPTRVRKMLSDAAEELVAAGVLRSHEWRGTPRRGPMEFVLEPGPLLQLSGLLRGIGLTDPPDVRVLYAGLRAFGVSKEKARAMIAEKPGQVTEVLLRAHHLQKTAPESVTKSWAGWIVYNVERDTPFVGEVNFRKWRDRALARLAAPVEGEPRASAPVDVAVDAPSGESRDRTDRPRPAAAPAALEEWEGILAALRPDLSPLDLYGVEDGVPVESRDDVLTVVVSNDIAARALARLTGRVESMLAARAGRPVALRVVQATAWPPATRTNPAEARP